MIYASSIRHQKAARVLHPRLFVAVGELGRSTLDRLSGVGSSLRVRCEGRFGFLEVAPQVQAQDSVDWTAANEPAEAADSRNLVEWREAWVVHEMGAELPSDELSVDAVSEPDWIGREESNRFRIPAHADSRQAIRHLVRRLNAIDPEIRIGDRHGAKLDVYLVLDLRELEGVRAGLKTLSMIQEEFRQLDVTVIMLTGRQPESTNDEDAAWKLGLAEIMQASERSAHTLPLHRAYLQDSENSRRQWCQSTEEACDTAAEFIFHHALGPYSRTIREYEACHVSKDHPFALSLGSFACRRLSSNLEQIAQETADALLLGTTLFGSESHSLNNYERDEMQLAAQRLKSALDEVFDPQLAEQHLGNMRDVVLGKIRDSLCEVAQQNPLGRLRAYMPFLKQVAETFRVKVRVIEARQERLHVTAELKRQWDQAEAPEPLGDGPSPQFPPEYVWFARPISKNRVRNGRLLIAAGFVLACLIGKWGLLPIALGLAFMFAGVLVMDMAKRPWIRFRFGNLWIGESNERRIGWKREDVATDNMNYPSLIYSDARQIPSVPTRVMPTAGQVLGGVALSVLGLALVMYTLAFEGGVLPHVIELAIVAALTVVAIIGSLVQRSGQRGATIKRSQSQHGELEGDSKGAKQSSGGSDHCPLFIDAEELRTDRIGTDYPLAYFPRTYGFWRAAMLAMLLIITCWVLTTWEISFRTIDFPFPTAIAAEWAPWFTRLGLLVFAGGIWIAARPREAKASVGTTEPPPPVRNWEDIPGPLRVSDEVDACLLETAEWLAGLFDTSPEHPLPEIQRWPEEPQQETFLDAITAQWPQRLAEQSRSYVEQCIEDPQNWADCILEGLSERVHRSPIRLESLDEEFVLRAVESWLHASVREHDWSPLIAQLDPEPSWLGRFFEREVAPMWTVRDREVLLDRGVALVDTKLAVAANAVPERLGERWRVVEVPWCRHDRDQALVVLIRLTQGIPDPVVRRLLH